MFFRLLVGIFLLSTPLTLASESSLRLSVRYREPGFGMGIFDQAIQYRWLSSKWFELDFGARVAENAWALYGLQYMAAATSHPLSFFSAGVRLAHKHQIREETSSSELLLRGDLHTTLFQHVRLFLSLGWATRPTRLSRPSLLPHYFSSDFSDPTWAAELGIELKQLGNFGGRFSFGNIDALETYNLNNPFFELGVSYHPRHSPLRYYVFTRYKLLLGFGRLDEFLVGLRVDWLLTR